MTTQHTPYIPLVARETNALGWTYIEPALGSDGTVCMAREEYAAFIVQACNSHDALLAAAQEALPLLVGYHLSLPDYPLSPDRQLPSTIAKLLAAIAEALDEFLKADAQSTSAGVQDGPLGGFTSSFGAGDGEGATMTTNTLENRREFGCPDCHIPLLATRSLGSQGYREGLHCNRCDRDFHIGYDGIGGAALLYSGLKVVKP